MLVWEAKVRLQGVAKRDNAMWHKVRVLASILVQPHLKKGKSIRPEDLIKLPDDVKEPTMTREEIKADRERKRQALIKHRGKS